jgi:hypothetical protein
VAHGVDAAEVQDQQAVARILDALENEIDRRAVVDVDVVIRRDAGLG